MRFDLFTCKIKIRVIFFLKKDFMQYRVNYKFYQNLPEAICAKSDMKYGHIKTTRIVPGIYEKL